MIRAVLTALMLWTAMAAAQETAEDAMRAIDRRDYRTAFMIFEMLAEAGDAEAAYHVGVMHLNGLGVVADTSEAARWFRRGAERGVTSAQYNLGLLYAMGSGVERDLKQAVLWLGRAADAGHARAANARDGLLPALAERPPVPQAPAATAAPTALVARAPDPEPEPAPEPEAEKPISGLVPDRANVLYADDDPAPDEPPVQVATAAPPPLPARTEAPKASPPTRAATPPPRPAPAATPPARPAPAPAPAAMPAPPAGGGTVRVQLGALRSAESADAELKRLRRIHQDLIHRLAPSVQRAETNNGVVWRLVSAHIPNRAEAFELCNRLQLRGERCFFLR